MPNVRIIAKGQRGDSLTKLKVNFTPTQSGTPWQSDEVNNAPYVFRSVPMGNREWNKLVGGTVSWNQLCKNSNYRSDGFETRGLTVTNNGDDYVLLNGTFNATGYADIYQSSTNSIIQGHKYFINVAPFVIGSTYYNVAVVGGGGFSYTDIKKPTILEGATTGNAYMYYRLAAYIPSGTVFSNFKAFIRCYDLTQMFGSTIANYAYSLEQATAGSGIEWLKKYDFFTKDHHAYSAPTLQSAQTSGHVVVGKNQLNPSEAFDGGSLYYTINADLSIEVTSSDGRAWANVPSCPILAGTYTLSRQQVSGLCDIRLGYENYATSHIVASGVSSITFTVTQDTEFKIKADYSASGYPLTDKLQLERGATATAYEPYTSTTYPTSPVTLRGIPMKDADGNLYYDGDTYEWDGTVTRRYAEVDLGTLDWATYSAPASHIFRAALNPNSVPTEGNSTPANIKSDKYVAMGYGPISASDDGYMAFGNNRLVIIDHNYSTVADFTTAVTGHKLIYLVVDASQTTESADPYTNPQVCDPDGTEEWTDYGVSQGTRDYAVPVGHESTYAMAYPISGTDSFTITANDGTAHTYPVSIGTTIYKGQVDVLDETYVSEMTNIESYNGETIGEPWLSSLDEYSPGTTPTTGAQVVYTSTPTEGSVTVTGDPSTLSGISSVTSDKGQVEWSELAEITGKTTLTIIKP